MAQPSTIVADLGVTLSDLVAACDLRAVDLVGLECDRQHDARPAPLERFDTAEVRVETGVSMPALLSVDGMSALCDFTATWVVGDAKVASVRAQMRVFYAIENLDRLPSRDTAEAFGNAIAVHHAWPFARERLHALSMALNLPILMLPLRPVPSF